MGANLRNLMTFLLGVLEQPGFWYCVTALACATILGNRILAAARHISFAASVMADASHHDIARIIERLQGRGALKAPADMSPLARTTPLHDVLRSIEE
jgi:hypothetical protein